MEIQKEKPVIFLSGARLYLRPLSKDDVPTITRYANDPEVRMYLANVYPLSLSEESEWVEKQMKRNIHNIIFCVCLKENDALLGLMGLHKIDYVNGIAETGAMLGEKDERNKGYGAEAKMLILEYAFLTLNLRKILSTAIADNKGSIKHNQNCGYKIDGVRKKHFYRKGKYCDEVLLSVLKKDWLKLRK
jgi:RimJ/RimL family protein N-acetyltransferase